MHKDAISLARLILSVRNDRTAYFDGGLFDEQAWELLLVLFVAAYDAEDYDRDRLIERVVGTPALLDRWIGVLLQKQIVAAPEWPAGTLTLTEDATERMNALLLSKAQAQAA